MAEYDNNKSNFEKKKPAKIDWITIILTGVRDWSVYRELYTFTKICTV